MWYILSAIAAILIVSNYSAASGTRVTERLQPIFIEQLQTWTNGGYAVLEAVGGNITNLLHDGGKFVNAVSNSFGLTEGDKLVIHIETSGSGEMPTCGLYDNNGNKLYKEFFLLAGVNDFNYTIPESGTYGLYLGNNNAMNYTINFSIKVQKNPVNITTSTSLSIDRASNTIRSR